VRIPTVREITIDVVRTNSCHFNSATSFFP
jgi:hypothetical protein